MPEEPRGEKKNKHGVVRRRRRRLFTYGRGRSRSRGEGALPPSDDNPDINVKMKSVPYQFLVSKGFRPERIM